MFVAFVAFVAAQCVTRVAFVMAAAASKSQTPSAWQDPGGTTAPITLELSPDHFGILPVALYEPRAVQLFRFYYGLYIPAICCQRRLWLAFFLCLYFSWALALAAADA